MIGPGNSALGVKGISSYLSLTSGNGMVNKVIDISSFLINNGFRKHVI